MIKKYAYIYICIYVTDCEKHVGVYVCIFQKNAYTSISVFLLCRLQYNLSLPFFPYPPINFFLHSSNSWLPSSVIFCACIHIPKYRSVTTMPLCYLNVNVFRDDPLVLDNLLVCSSLEKTTSAFLCLHFCISMSSGVCVLFRLMYIKHMYITYIPSELYVYLSKPLGNSLRKSQSYQ